MDVGTGYYVKKVCVTCTSTLSRDYAELTSCPDARAGLETLRGQGGLHPYESRGPSGYHFQEARQHELSREHYAGQAARAGCTEGLEGMIMMAIEVVIQNVALRLVLLTHEIFLDGGCKYLC